MSEALLRAIADLEARLRMLERLEMPTVSGGGAGAPASATYLTLEAEAALGAERRLVLAGRLVGTDAGGNSTYTVDLAASGVVAGTYGSATQVPQITTDAYGRVTAVTQVAITMPLSVTTRVTSAGSPYAVLATDEVILADTDGGAIVVNLPAGVDGKHYKVVNCGGAGNDVTLNANGAETVRGLAAQTLHDGEVLDMHFETTEGWW